MPEPIIDPERSMKPLLGHLIKEAVHLALMDCCLAEEMEEQIKANGIDWWLDGGYDQVKTEWAHDVYAIPDRHFARMDPGALAQCVAVRLLGSGGWMVGGVYGGNATPRELLDATFERPDRSEVSEVAFDVLRAMDDATQINKSDGPTAAEGNDNA